MASQTILFVSKSINSASTRYRATAYFKLLEKDNFKSNHIAVGKSILSYFLLLKAAKQADVVIIIRKTMHPLYLWLLRRMSKKIIFDFDDAIFSKSNGKASSRRYNQFNKIVSCADYVWAGNAFLAETAKALNSKTLIIPTSIDVDKYYSKSGEVNDYFDLVWIGSTSTKRYLLNILDTLEDIATELPMIRLKVIADFEFSTKHLKTLFIPWSEDTEVAELASSHVGIAPLIENTWTIGKCGLKVVQYMAAGLPVISSPIGANAEIINDQTGIFASTQMEWHQAIKSLLENKTLRKKLGQASEARAREVYSIQTNYNLIATSLHTSLSSL